MNFNEPGNLTELTPELRALWVAEQSLFFENGIQVAKNEASPASEKAWMFNPIADLPAGYVVADVKWNAFPKRLLDRFGSKLAAWKDADRSRGRQEEYCEWEVVRDPVDNSVLRITFSTETPEYYEFLYKNDQALLLDLYHKHVSPNAKITDFEALVDGEVVYNSQNIWNYPENQQKRGVLMHMGFGPNTLNAAIILSAEATWPSINAAGEIITDEQGLIDCRGYGARERHSDPHIGAEINALVRSGKTISFAGPTGLYIDEIDLSNFEVPNGFKAEDLFRIVRGDKDHMMRVVFEAPKDSGFKLSDVKIDGTKIAFGGQIAEKITIRIKGIALSAEVPPTINCAGEIAGLTSFNTAFLAVSSRKPTLDYVSSLE